MTKCDVRVLVSRAWHTLIPPRIPLPAAAPFSAFIIAQSNSFILPLDHTPSHSFPSIPSVAGVAAVSHESNVDKVVTETAATSSTRTFTAVGRITANDGIGAVDVPADLAGTINPGTPTSPFLPPEAASGAQDEGASVDRNAGVHDDFAVNKGSAAWRPAPRLVYGETIDAIRDGTRMTLGLHWSGTRTPDSSGEPRQACVAMQGLPAGRVALAIADGRVERLPPSGAGEAPWIHCSECNADAGVQDGDDSCQAGSHAAASRVPPWRPGAIPSGGAVLSRAARWGGGRIPTRRAGGGQAVASRLRRS